MFSFRFSAEAEADFRESYDYYELRKDGLGEQFGEAVYTALDKVAANPQYYGMIDAGLRKISVSVFPFLLVYEIDAAVEIVNVVAVAHTSRDMSGRYRGE